jgi:hypothetical protein
VAKSRVARAGSIAAEAQQALWKLQNDINRLGAPVTKGLRDVFHRSKDATLAFTARVAINTKLRSIGEMTELSIDTKNKRVRARLELLGENEPIDVEIVRYSLKGTGEMARITIEEATSSREWLTVALREFVVGQDLPIPAKAAALLKLLT